MLALAFIVTACDNNPLQKSIDKPLPGKIVFSAKQGSSNYNQIYTVNADGTDRQQVTFFAANNAYSPSWAPDGRNIVFVSDSLYIFDGGAGIFTVAGNGSGLQAVKAGPLIGPHGSDPVISPLGNLIAYYVCTISDCNNIVVLEFNQDQPVGLRRGSHPNWSSDGSNIAFFLYDDETAARQIFIADPKLYIPNDPGTRVTSTPGDKNTPVWSPDDTRIAFISGSQIYIHTLEVGAEIELTPVGLPETLVPFDLHSWVGGEAEYMLISYVDKTQIRNKKYYLYAFHLQSGGLTLIVPDSTIRGADWYLP